MNNILARKKVNDALLMINSLGDEDECSIKHIEHALIALVEGAGILNAIDYKKPSADMSEDDWLKCVDAWGDVAAVFAVYGKEFILDCHKTYFSGYDIKSGYAYALFNKTNK